MWLPSVFKGSSTDVTALGVTVIVPFTRLMMGGLEISSIVMTSSDPVQCIEDGPTVSVSGVVFSALRPRSVIVKRPPAP